MKYFRKYVLSILLCFILTGCGQQAGFSESVSAVPESNFTESQTGVLETVMQQQTDADAETAETKSASDNVRPSKEEVLAMREKTLDGMPETEISRLREYKLTGLQLFYEFCIREQITDIQLLELEQETAFQDYLKKKPEFVIEEAVRGMLPKTRLGEAIFKNLKVYAGAEHPHAAQNPKAIKLNEIK